MSYIRPAGYKPHLRIQPLVRLLTETPIMAPLAAGAALLITHEFENSQIWPRPLVTRMASGQNDNGSVGHEMWIFAPILMFMLVLVSVFWIACVGRRLVRREVEKQTEDAKANLLSATKDLPEPRLWAHVRGLITDDGKMVETRINSPGNDISIPHTSTTEEDLCSICLEVFVSSDMIRQMRTCNHVFHQKCFEDWVTKHQTDAETCTTKLRCPMCRAVIATPTMDMCLRKPPEVHYAF